MSRFTQLTTQLSAALLTGMMSMLAAAATPEQLLDGYRNQAGRAPQAAQGQTFFLTQHGGQWSCASCHGSRPSDEGKHASTGKLIRPLAPAANAQRFTDPQKVEKWFKRNCKDVLERECTAAEKADVLAWLLTVQP
ncbi:MAG: DUF1924 domain-containing protein [Burkholderiales bacterium]|nr:DUF1924 domain-containing protein [Burkholderiales bacterium]